MLRDEIAAGESDTLEFKRELPSKDKKVLKSIVAFANGKGGRVVFGVNDETLEIVGVEVTSVARTLDGLTNMIADSCSPQLVPDISIENIDGKNLIVVRIYPGRNTPYYLNSEGLENGTYIRVGATTRKAEAETRYELLLRGKRINYDETLLHKEAPATSEEISYLCSAIEQRAGLSKGKVTAGNLISWGLLHENEDGSVLPSVCFCLLARPHAVYFSRIQCALFKGTEKVHFLDRKELQGPLHELVDAAETFVLQHTRVAARIEGLYRDDVYEIPRAALREIIVNAVLHRNYLLHSQIQISIFDDRIEFLSPGGLHGDLTPEQLVNGGRSSLRNPLLADILQKMNIAEKWGTGICRIFESFSQAGLPVPEYRITDSEVLLVVRRQPLTVNAVRQHATPDNPPQKTHTARKPRTSVPEADILAYIRRHQPVSFSILCAEFNISRRTIATKLDSLNKQGLIARTGQTRNALWRALT